jgi:hypothetical protein
MRHGPSKGISNAMALPAVTDAELDAQVAAVDVEVFEPAYEAFKLRRRGESWEDAARKTGYASKNSCAMAISHYLQKAAAMQSAAHLQEALQIEVSRYEVLINEWWDLGTSGHDEKAAAVLLRTLQQLERVQKLTDGDAVITRETLVISADRDEYIRQVQEADAERSRG